MDNEKRSLRDLRTGRPPHKIVHLGDENDGFDVAVVVLSADKCLEMEEQTQQYCSTKPNSCNEAVKNQFYNALLCLNCVRDSNDLNTPLANDLKEVMECLDIEDINRVIKAYGELMMNKAPKLELLTDEQLEEVKKFLEETPSSALSTVLRAHLAVCHQQIVSDR